MSERQIARNPGPVEVRLHCLDMAVRSGVLSGRADGLMQLADQYYEWVTKELAAKAAAPSPEPAAPAPAESVDLDPEPAPKATVPSLRQAGGKQ